jgi:aminoglycoside phosphotransferase (APT) family kinase protein
VAVEEGWQRRTAFVDLTPQEIERLIQPFASRAQVVDATPLSGGLRNTNYRVQLSGQAAPLVLRLYAADPSACPREMALLRLVESKVPVPRVLHAETRADPPWAVLSFVEGIRFDQFIRLATEPDVERAAYSAGRVLAAIHTYQFPRAGFFGPGLEVETSLAAEGGLATMLDGWLVHGPSGARLGADLTARLRRFIAANTAHLDALGRQSRLQHADYKPWNLLLQANNEIAAVLDWEFAFSGAPSNDIGIFLRYSATQPEAYRAGFVRGYLEAGGQLPPDWFRLARLNDLICLCYFLERPADDPAVVRDVRPLIEATLRDFASAGAHAESTHP